MLWGSAIIRKRKIIDIPGNQRVNCHRLCSLEDSENSCLKSAAWSERLHEKLSNMFVFLIAVSVVDRNGSLETNESSSPEASQQPDQNSPPDPSLTMPIAPEFDFNEFFNIENIPGLNVSYTTYQYMFSH